MPWLCTTIASNKEIEAFLGGNEPEAVSLKVSLCQSNVHQ